MTDGHRRAFAYRVSGCRGEFVHLRGHRAVVLENRGIKVVISLSRGGEILELRDKRTDIDLLWHFDDDLLAARPFIPSVNLEGGNFLDHFAGGWQEVFPAGGEHSTYLGAVYGLHGEVALLPWRCEIDVDEPTCVTVHLWTRCRRYPFMLERRLTIRDDSAALEWHARATNLSDLRLPVMWGHHISLGPPFIGEATELWVVDDPKVDIPAELVTEHYAFAAGSGTWPHVKLADGSPGLADRFIGPPPSEGHLIVGPMTTGAARVRNAEVDLAFVVEWSARELPYLWFWEVNCGYPHYPLYGTQTLLAVEPFSSPWTTLAQAAESGQALMVVGRGKVEHWLRAQLTPATGPNSSTTLPATTGVRRSP